MADTYSTRLLCLLFVVLSCCTVYCYGWCDCDYTYQTCVNGVCTAKCSYMYPYGYCPGDEYCDYGSCREVQVPLSAGAYVGIAIANLVFWGLVIFCCIRVCCRNRQSTTAYVIQPTAQTTLSSVNISNVHAGTQYGTQPPASGMTAYPPAGAYPPTGAYPPPPPPYSPKGNMS